MRYGTLLVLCLLTGLATPVAAEPEKICTGVAADFASCAKAERNFHSVIVAVHGWGGSCKETFGSGKLSLFEGLRQPARAFYDVDCFPYESRDYTIEQSARHLRAHLLELKKLGYNEVFLLTHSMGGMVTLRLLTDLFLDDAGQFRSDTDWWASRDNNARDFRIVAIHAWAAPINGVRPDITLMSYLSGLLGWQRTSVEQLTPGRPYLKAFRERLDQLHTQLEQSTDAKMRARGAVPIRFLHGQRSDWVVVPIDAADAWFRANNREAIVTDLAHLGNLGEDSDIRMPFWPAKMVEDDLLRKMVPYPRWKDVFPEWPQNRSLPGSIVERQQRVAASLAHYAQSNSTHFTSLYDSTRDFFGALLENCRARSREVDKTLLDDFYQLVLQHAATPNDQLVSFFYGFFVNVLQKYAPAEGPSTCRVGHGDSSVASRILDLSAVMGDTILKYVEEDSFGRRYLIGNEDPQQFRARLQRVLASYLDSPHRPVKVAAIDKLTGAVSEGGDPTIRDSGALAVVAAYYSRRYDKMPVENQQEVGQFFVKVAQKSGEMRQEVTALLSAPARDGITTPLWAKLPGATVNELVDVIGAGTGNDGDIKFLSQVVGRAGTTRRDADLAGRAATALKVSGEQEALQTGIAELMKIQPAMALQVAQTLQ